MQCMAMALAGQGKAHKAVRLSGAAEVKMKSLGLDPSAFQFWMDFMDQYLSPARQHVGAESAATFEAEGREMDFKDAVTYALDLAVE
jgi:hypothetical protein